MITLQENLNSSSALAVAVIVVAGSARVPGARRRTSPVLRTRPEFGYVLQSERDRGRRIDR